MQEPVRATPLTGSCWMAAVDPHMHRKKWLSRFRAAGQKLHLVSLGCAKNQVDSEVMLGRLKQAGWTITNDPEEAQAIVVNTCSFIQTAAEESIDTIVELAEYKKTGTCRRLVVTGCLPERYREQIVQAIPEVDIFLGTGAFDQIVQAVGDDQVVRDAILPDPELTCLDQHSAARVLTAPHMAYLKIAEGCSNRCSYCIIPKLRGRHKSQPGPGVIRRQGAGSGGPGLHRLWAGFKPSGDAGPSHQRVGRLVRRRRG